MRDFELTYAAYNEFQRQMERYWCLRWLDQQGLSRVEAVVAHLRGRFGDAVISDAIEPLWNLDAGDVDALRDELDLDPDLAGAHNADGLSAVLYALMLAGSVAIVPLFAMPAAVPWVVAIMSMAGQPV